MNERVAKKMLLLAPALLVLLLILIANVAAIGITPGMVTIDFEPGLRRGGEFTIINNEHKKFNALVFVEGDLKDNIILSKNLVEFDETINSLPFTYTINLPSSIEKPGEHFARIVVMEISPPETREEVYGSTLIAVAAVVHQVKVKVPYPGKYAEMELYVEESMVNEITSFITPVSNLGEEDIKKAKTKIEILGPTNEKITMVETNEGIIKSKERKELTAQWRANVNAGFYHAVATLEYDGKFARAEKTFSVGNLLVEVNDITVKDFTLGTVAKFNIDIESKWNGDIKGIYAQMQIYNAAGDLIADFKSASIDLKPLEKAVLNAYWDTEGISIGDYDAKIILHYSDKTTERQLKVSVGMHDIKTEIIGMAGMVTEEEKVEAKAKITNRMIFLLIIALIIINIAWFVYFKRRKKKKEKQK